MSTANAKQVGGDHYQTNNGYQHWDLMKDLGLPYHPATATKYLTRWRKKNGRQDLEKALHYVQKTLEIARAHERSMIDDVDGFLTGHSDMGLGESRALRRIAAAFAPNVMWLEEAEDIIKGLIESTENA